MNNIIRSSKDFGHALKKARLNTDKSQSDLARANGTTQNEMSRLERGYMGSKVKLIFKLLAMLDLEIVVRPRTKGSDNDIESLFP